MVCNPLRDLPFVQRVGFQDFCLVFEALVETGALVKVLARETQDKDSVRGRNLQVILKRLEGRKLLSLLDDDQLIRAGNRISPAKADNLSGIGLVSVDNAQVEVFLALVQDCGVESIDDHI